MPIFDEDIDGFSDGSKAKDPGMITSVTVIGAKTRSIIQQKTSNKNQK
jgi:hypothetical protein